MSEPAAARRSPNATLLVLAVAAMSYALSQSMVIPALPRLQRDLHTSETTITFVLTAFLLSSAVSTPILGRFGDMFGKRRVLLWTLGIFAVGTLAAALADSVGQLIAARVIQGTGGAVFPLAFGIIRDEFPPPKVAASIGLISAVFGIGGGTGPVLAGVIVDHTSDTWIFWSTLIVIAIALAAVWRFVPESPVRAPAPIDWAGAGLMAVGLASLLVGVSRANTWGWGSSRVLGLFAFAALVLAGWARVESRRRHPLVDMRLMARRAVLIPNLVALVIGFGMFGSFVLIPAFVQTPPQAGYGFGESVTGAGLFLLPLSLVMLVAGPIAGRVAGRRGAKAPLVVGTLFSSGAFVVLALDHDHRAGIYLGGALLGVGIGLTLASMANLVVEAVAATETGVATGINTIMRSIGGAFGAQVAASVVAAHFIAGTRFPRESGYTTAFVISAVAALVATAIASLLRPRPAPRPA